MTKNDIKVEESENCVDETSPKNWLRKIRLFFRALKPIITSHHPLCEYYDGHTFKLLGRKFCIGCYVGYPSAIIMLIIGYSTQLFSLIPSSILFLFGAILYLSIFLSIFGLTKKKSIKILSKICLGMGTTFIIAWIFSYSTFLWLKILQAFLFVQAILGLMTIKRKKEMDRICEKCPWNRDWNNCPGMRQVSSQLKRI